MTRHQRSIYEGPKRLFNNGRKNGFAGFVTYDRDSTAFIIPEIAVVRSIVFGNVAFGSIKQCAEPFAIRTVIAVEVNVVGVCRFHVSLFET